MVMDDNFTALVLGGLNYEIGDAKPLPVLLGKRKRVEDEAVLSLLIYNLEAKDIDDPATYDFGPFCARFWTEPGDGTIHKTSTYEYGWNPKWHGTTTIRFDTNIVNGGCLYVEILRRGIDPCTSDDDSATIGRAKFSLPEEVGVETKSHRGLVRIDGGECRPHEEGKVMVTMKWQWD